MKRLLFASFLSLIFFMSSCSAEKKEIINNDYFFNRDISTVSCDAIFNFEEGGKESTVLTITLVKTFSQGAVYNIHIDSNSYAPVDRENLGYFYVQQEKIIKIDDFSYDQSFDENELTEIGTVVCQQDEKKDSISEDEKGWHEYIMVNGDTVEYHGYNNLVQTGYYEVFIWQKNVGLIHYRSGFGAGRDSIEIATGETQGQSGLV